MSAVPTRVMRDKTNRRNTSKTCTNQWTPAQRLLRPKNISLQSLEKKKPRNACYSSRYCTSNRRSARKRGKRVVYLLSFCIDCVCACAVRTNTESQAAVATSHRCEAILRYFFRHCDSTKRTNSHTICTDGIEVPLSICLIAIFCDTFYYVNIEYKIVIAKRIFANSGKAPIEFAGGRLRKNQMSNVDYA